MVSEWYHKWYYKWYYKWYHKWYLLSALLKIEEVFCILIYMKIYHVDKIV